MQNNEIYLVLRITSKKDIKNIVENNNIKPTKIWKKGDIKIKGSILKYKNFGFKIEKRYRNISYIKNILIKFLKDENVIKSISLQNVEKALIVIIYGKNTDDYTGNLPSLYYDIQILEILNKNGINLEHDIYLMKNM